MARTKQGTEVAHVGNHFRVECSCGQIMAQCRCPSKDKIVTVKEKACERCQMEESIKPVKTIMLEIEGDVLIVDGVKISREFFCTLSNPDPSQLYRLHKHPESGAVLFEKVDLQQ